MTWVVPALLTLYASLRLGGVALADLELLSLSALLVVALGVGSSALRTSPGGPGAPCRPGWGVLVVGIPLLVSAPAAIGGPGVRGHLLALLLWSGYALGRWSTCRPQGRRALIAILAVVALAQGSWAVLQGLGWLAAPALTGASGSLRNPNHFATLLALTMPFALLLATEVRKLAWPLVSATLVLWLAALAASGSRGGWLALVGGLVVLWLGTRALPGIPRLLRRHGPLRLGLVLLSAVFPALLVIGLGWRPLGEIFGLERRLLLYGDVLSLVADHPWHGVGLGMFRWRFRAYQEFELADRYDFAHCEPLELAAELGIPLALLLLLWLGRRLFVALCRAREGEGGRRPLALAVGGSLAVTFCHGSIDFGLRIPLVTLVLGMVVALAASLDGEEEPAPRPGRGWRLLALVVGVLLVATSWRLGRQLVALQVAGEGAEVAALRSALAWDGELAALHFALARRLEHDPAERDPRRAREHLVQAVEHNPWSFRYRSALGRLDEDYGRFSEAEASYRSALALAPRSPRALWQLAEFHLGRGETSRALALGWRAAAEDPRLLPVLAEHWLAAGVEPAAVVHGWPPRRSGELLALLADRGLEDAALLETLFERWLALGSSSGAEPEVAGSYLEYLLTRGELARFAEVRRRLLTAWWGSEALEDGDERVWNGGFDHPLTDTVLGWQVPRQVERRVEPDGSTSLELGSGMGDGEARRRVRQLVSTTPGERLRFEYRVSDQGQGVEACRLQLFDPRARRILWRAPEPDTRDETGWRRVTAEVAIPLGVDHLLVRSGVGTGRCRIDEVSLRAVGTAVGAEED